MPSTEMASTELDVAEGLSQKVCLGPRERLRVGEVHDL